MKCSFASKLIRAWSSLGLGQVSHVGLIVTRSIRWSRQWYTQSPQPFNAILQSNKSSTKTEVSKVGGLTETQSINVLLLGHCNQRHYQVGQEGIAPFDVIIKLGPVIIRE